MPLRNDSLQLGVEALDAKAALEKSGYRLPGRPQGDPPRLPGSGIGMLSDDELMDLYTEFTRWLDHISGVLGMTEIDERFADSAYDLVWASVLSQANVGKAKSDSSVTMAKAETTTDPDVVSMRDRKDQCYARRKVLQMMHTNLERDAAILSRELTRRLGRHEHENRSSRGRP